MAMAVRNAGDLFLPNGERRQGPPAFLDELRRVLHRRNPQAPPLPPRDVDVDQPLTAGDLQEPAPPQSSGRGWKWAYAAGATFFGAAGLTAVGAAHAATKLVRYATAPKKNLEVTV